MPGRLGNGWRRVLESHGREELWPNADERRLLMYSVTGGKPVRVDTSTLANDATSAMWVENVALAFHVECLRRFSSHESNIPPVQPSQSYNMGRRNGLRSEGLVWLIGLEQWYVCMLTR